MTSVMHFIYEHLTRVSKASGFDLIPRNRTPGNPNLNQVQYNYLRNGKFMKWVKNLIFVYIMSQSSMDGHAFDKHRIKKKTN